ncbi:MAG: tRNA (guanosine(46)-N7)-methyltransferase TrmB [Francisella sp.]
MYNKNKENMRQIKSYVTRAGRITKKQQQALDNYAKKYLIEYNQNHKLDFTKVFKNSKDVILEIGFGMGHSLIEMALKNPNKNYLGIEVHKAGVGNILYEIEHQNIPNLLVISHDAVEVLENMIEDDSLSGIQIFFPDPWHKKRHHKRRLVNQKNIELFAKKLKKDGIFHFASDWMPYSQEVLDLLENNNNYKNLYNGFAPRPEWRPLTKFEKRGQNLDHQIADIIFEKI